MTVLRGTDTFFLGGAWHSIVYEQTKLEHMRPESEPRKPMIIWILD